MTKLTKKQERLKVYNKIITKNRKLLKAGATLTRAQFTKMFKIAGITNKGAYEKVHRSNLQLVGVQAELNVLMRENGLYLKSSDYYNEFSIASKDSVKSTVERFSKEVDIYYACTNRLIDKVEKRTSAGTWGTYNNVPVSTISTMGSISHSNRHLRTITRLKTI